MLLTYSRLNLCCAQRYEKGRGLAFHFDKDEHAMRETGAMLQPQLSSIVYLTGDSDMQRQGAHCAPECCTCKHADAMLVQPASTRMSSSGRCSAWVSNHVSIDHVERQTHI